MLPLPWGKIRILSLMDLLSSSWPCSRILPSVKSTPKLNPIGWWQTNASPSAYPLLMDLPLITIDIFHRLSSADMMTW